MKNLAKALFATTFSLMLFACQTDTEAGDDKKGDDSDSTAVVGDTTIAPPIVNDTTSLVIDTTSVEDPS
jgi:hypothetical protein